MSLLRAALSGHTQLNVAFDFYEPPVRSPSLDYLCMLYALFSWAISTSTTWQQLWSSFSKMWQACVAGEGEIHFCVCEHEYGKLIKAQMSINCLMASGERAANNRNYGQIIMSHYELIWLSFSTTLTGTGDMELIATPNVPFKFECLRFWKLPLRAFSAHRHPPSLTNW